MDKGCLNERLTKLRNLAIALALALAVTICMGGAANARVFSDNALHGGYGCLATIIDISGVLDQLALDGKGNITSGTGWTNFEGEVCAFTVNPTGSSYTVTSTGVGTLTVHIDTATDPDGDTTFPKHCSDLSGASLHYTIVVESGGKRFDLSALDPFFTGAAFIGSDPGDSIESGACNRQVGG